MGPRLDRALHGGIGGSGVGGRKTQMPQQPTKAGGVEREEVAKLPSGERLRHTARRKKPGKKITGCKFHGLLTAFPKMDLPSAHGLHMVREALFLIEREAVFPAPAS